MAASGCITYCSFCSDRFKSNQSDQTVKFVLLAGFIQRRVNHVSKIHAPTNNQKHQKKTTTTTKNNKQRTANRLQQDQITTNQTEQFQSTSNNKQANKRLTCCLVQICRRRGQDCFNVVEKKCSFVKHHCQDHQNVPKFLNTLSQKLGKMQDHVFFSII